MLYSHHFLALSTPCFKSATDPSVWFRTRKLSIWLQLGPDSDARKESSRLLSLVSLGQNLFPL